MLKKALFAVVLCLASAVSSNAAYVYVGSWDLSDLNGNYNNPDNPYLWTNNPTVFSGVEAAAHLFGGNASEYVISTIDSNVANINRLAFLDGWGDNQYLYDPQADTWKLDSGAPGYNAPYGGPAYSALVTDHAPFEGRSFVNYAFRDTCDSVPDGAWTFGMMGIAMGALALIRRRK